GADRLVLLLMLPTVLLLYALHGVAWWIALRGLGARIGPRQAITICFISQAFVLLPGGDLWRVPIVRAEDRRTDPGRIAASVIFDDLVFYFVLTFAMVPAVVRVPMLAVPLAVALLPQVTIFWILLSPRLYAFLASRVGHLRLLRRFEPQLLMLGPSFRELMTARTLVPIVIVDAGCALLATALFGLSVAAVHETGFGFQQIGFTYASGQVLAGLASFPAALGIFEGMMTGFMAVQGVAPAVAAAAAFIYRAVNDVLMAIIGLGVAFVFERESLRQIIHPANVSAG
ncbi:MAG TPA: lysylphosphatidylglycerol synthase domain-containing protein, partial [Patescibacteria group bacterium]|nr:lysylphosphatidylglycerol synthase domain-containing protein [Patescibacteria group bacterium]